MESYSIQVNKEEMKRTSALLGVHSSVRLFACVSSLLSDELVPLAVLG